MCFSYPTPASCLPIPSFGIGLDRKKGKEKGSKGLFIVLLLKQLMQDQHTLDAWLGSGRAEQEINLCKTSFKMNFRSSEDVKTSVDLFQYKAFLTLHGAGFAESWSEP